jgi:hypothetical protein
MPGLEWADHHTDAVTRPTSDRDWIGRPAPVEHVPLVLEGRLVSPKFGPTSDAALLLPFGTAPALPALRAKAGTFLPTSAASLHGIGYAMTIEPPVPIAGPVAGAESMRGSFRGQAQPSAAATTPRGPARDGVSMQATSARAMKHAMSGQVRAPCRVRCPLMWQGVAQARVL